jgi:hypothetical protein
MYVCTWVRILHSHRILRERWIGLPPIYLAQHEWACSASFPRRHSEYEVCQLTVEATVLPRSAMPD